VKAYLYWKLISLTSGLMKLNGGDINGKNAFKEER